MAKVQDLVHQFTEAEKMLAAERKIVEQNEWGYGPPRHMNPKEFNKLRRNVPEPPLEWKRMLSTHFLKRNGIGRPATSRGQSKNQTEVTEGVKAARDMAGDTGGEHRTVYTLPGAGFEAKGLEPGDVGADTHIEFKEPQQKNQNNRNKNQRNNNNRKQNNQNQDQDND
jgi:hypothetical protein